MTNKEKAKWFDLIVAECLQVEKGDTGWTVNRGHGGYQGQGCYEDDAVGETLDEAYANFCARTKEKHNVAQG